MQCSRSLLLALSMTLVASSAFAQKEEPKPPGSEGDDAEAPPARPGDPHVTPTPPYTSTQSAQAAAEAGKKFYPLDWRDSLGAYAHYLFVTNLMLKPYLESATQLNSFDVGIQYTRRFRTFDVVTSLDFSWLTLDDGNWLGKGNDPSLDTKYVQFDKLSFLSADVTVVGHHAFNNWLELKYGAGLGLGVVFGQVYTTSDSNKVCHGDVAATATTPALKYNAGDTSSCYPISPTVGPIYLNQPTTNAKLAQTQQSDALDVAQDPHRKQASKPPVMAVVNVLVGLNFRLQKHVTAQFEIGFRDAMFVGAGFAYLF